MDVPVGCATQRGTLPRSDVQTMPLIVGQHENLSGPCLSRPVAPTDKYGHGTMHTWAEGPGLGTIQICIVV